MTLLIYWIVSAISLILSAFIAQAFGQDIVLNTVEPWRIVIGVAVLGLVNATFGRIAKLITLPLNCLTFGLVWLLINAALFYWVGHFGTREHPALGFWVGDFWAAIIGSLLMGLVLGILQRVTANESAR